MGGRFAKELWGRRRFVVADEGWQGSVLCVELLCLGVVALLNDGDAVERCVELAVAAAV